MFRCVIHRLQGDIFSFLLKHIQKCRRNVVNILLHWYICEFSWYICRGSCEKAWNGKRQKNFKKKQKCGLEVQKFFKKSRSHIQILGARNMTWSELHTGDPQFCRHPCYLALSTQRMYTNNFCVYKRKTTIITLRILVAILANLLTTSTKFAAAAHNFATCTRLYEQAAQ